MTFFLTLNETATYFLTYKATGSLRNDRQSGSIHPNWKALNMGCGNFEGLTQFRQSLLFSSSIKKKTKGGTQLAGWILTYNMDLHKKWCNQHVTSIGQRKNLSPQNKLNLWPSADRSDALTTELRRTHGELGHIHYMVHVWHASYILQGSAMSEERC